MEGFQVEAQHILNSKVTRTEVEDMLVSKYNQISGANAEDKLNRVEQTVDSIEQKVEESQETLEENLNKMQEKFDAL